jgi:hypothetical protein
VSKKSKKKKMTIAQMKEKLERIEERKRRKVAYAMLKNNHNSFIDAKEKTKRKAKKHKKDYKFTDGE